MSKPVLLAVDDDPAVLRAVERDLRARYAADYRVVRAESGEVALDAIRQLVDRGDPIALMLVDQRMPGLSGVAFLDQAKTLAPDAKRVLLTAYADTDAAIAAINDVGLDYYLLKPWDPPEERLFPVLDDLIDAWRGVYRAPFEGIRVVGDRWSPHSHLVRDFLARYQIPYLWLDIERSAEAAQLAERVPVDDRRLPLVLMADGELLGDPSLDELAQKLGLQTRAAQPFYDLIIVGAGPAGLAAAVYGASEGLSTVIVEREAPGGQAGQSSRIENYLGFPVGLSGDDLSRRAVTQARRFGVEILAPQSAMSLRMADPYRYLTLSDGSEIGCYALIVATGVSYQRLDVPGMERLAGAGVYYGAARTEALSVQGEEIYIVGGANSAGQAAVYFAGYAKRVRMVVRGAGLSAGMSRYLVDQIEATPNIEVLPFTQVVAASGESQLEGLTLEDLGTKARTDVPATSLFVFIGARPHTDWLAGVVERDDRGFIRSGPDLIRGDQRPLGWTPDRDPLLLETSVPGVFVAGDVRAGSVKRVASGVGEGAIAVSLIHQHLAGSR